MGLDRYAFRIGDFECLAVRDASDEIPWARLVPKCYEAAAVKSLSMRGAPTVCASLDFLCLVVRTGSELVVIDAGIGFTEGVQGAFAKNLLDNGISPSDVSLVLITHHDRDHLAGIIAPDGRLAFPHARHVLTSEGWGWYTSEVNLAAMPEAHALFHRAIRSLLSGRVTLTKGEAEIVPGIRMIPAPGHRPGHVAFEVVSRGKRLLHLADTVTHPIFIEHPEWGTGFDSAPDEALATRRRFLNLAVDQGSLVFLSHFPFPGVGSIARVAGTCRWVPIRSPETGARPSVNRDGDEPLGDLNCGA